MRIFAVLMALCASSAPALAHTLFTSPTPRNNSDALKTGPCGNVAPTGSPTVLAAGQTIRVTWLETIDHPGYYRIAFSPGNDEGYDDNVLVDDIADVQCTDTPCSYAADVTLPDQPCQGCSLQLIQYMGTAPPYSPYFSCADIALVDGPLPDGGAGGGVSPGEGGCRASRPADAAPWLWLLILLALWQVCRVGRG